MSTGAQKIVETLIESGVDHVFGIPGGATGAIFNAFHGREEVKIVLARHEQSAAVMADVHGRLTGRPAVVMGQGPFIGTSAGFGIMEAYTSHSPMLAITDTSDNEFWQSGPTQGATGEYGTPDLLAMLRAMTKYTTLATTPNEAVLGVKLALKHSLAGAPGPSAVLLKTMASFGEFDPKVNPSAYSVEGYMNNDTGMSSPDGVDTLVKALIEADFPVIIAGNGVHLSKAHEELSELAEYFSIPIATTYKGKSAIEETHPLAIGPSGVFGLEVSNKTISQADLVLVVGSRLRPQGITSKFQKLLDPSKQRIFQIDIETRNAGWTVPIELGLIGDLKLVLRQILDVAKSENIDLLSREQKIKSIASLKEELCFMDDSPGLTSDQIPILPQRLVRLLQETVDPITMITLDAGHNRTWMHHFYQSQKPLTFLNPGGMAGMGWSIPAAIGAKIVQPRRPVMAITGDGGFVMTAHSISTAVQYDIPIVIVVMNDSGLGMVREAQRPNVVASDFIPTNHAKIGESFGAWGIQVDDPKDVPAALQDAFAAGKPAVVDVLIDQNEKFAPFRTGLSEFGR